MISTGLRRFMRRCPGLMSWRPMFSRFTGSIRTCFILWNRAAQAEVDSRKLDLMEVKAKRALAKEKEQYEEVLKLSGGLLKKLEEERKTDGDSGGEAFRAGSQGSGGFPGNGVVPLEPWRTEKCTGADR